MRSCWGFVPQSFFGVRCTSPFWRLAARSRWGFISQSFFWTQKYFPLLSNTPWLGNLGLWLRTITWNKRISRFRMVIFPHWMSDHCQVKLLALWRRAIFLKEGWWPKKNVLWIWLATSGRKSGLVAIWAFSGLRRLLWKWVTFFGLRRYRSFWQGRATFGGRKNMSFGRHNEFEVNSLPTGWATLSRMIRLLIIRYFRLRRALFEKAPLFFGNKFLFSELRTTFRFPTNSVYTLVGRFCAWPWTCGLGARAVSLL